MSALSELQGNIRGKLREKALLGPTTWFQVGGPADVLFRPEDAADLALFLKALPCDIPCMVIGVGSNLLVRDGGVKGVVVKLGRNFTRIQEEGGHIRAGAGALGLHLAMAAEDMGLSGLEFLSGIPGTVGGALAMNAGAYNSETADVLVEAELLTREGETLRMTPQELRYAYRSAVIPEGAVFISGLFRAAKGDRDKIATRMDEIAAKRAATQPVKSRTGGSTFKNPEGHKAWELIDQAGCRGKKIGAAQVSEMHCNFLINTGGATASELEQLGENVRAEVHAHSGIMLEWEIKRIGVR